MVPPPDPQVRRVDGPMLPHLNRSPRTPFRSLSSRPSLVPILTPRPSWPLSKSESGRRRGGDGDHREVRRRLLLVPSAERIVVRDARYGKRMCELVPCGEEAGIRAMALARLPPRRGQGGGRRGEEGRGRHDDEGSSSDGVGEDGEWAVLAGCTGGIVLEWPIAGIRPDSPGSLSGRGNCNWPRRSFQLSCGGAKVTDLVHLASIRGGVADDATVAVLYALCGDEGGATWLARCEVPPFVPSVGCMDQGELLSLPAKKLALVKAVPLMAYDQEASISEHVCLKKKDAIFGLVAARGPVSNDTRWTDYDDAGEGDVFVVMCASHGLIIYRDSRQQPPKHSRCPSGDANTSGSLVHFTKLVRASQYQPKEQSSLSSLAVSPDVRDLALGRTNGCIEILNNVFENVADYLDRPLGNKFNGGHVGPRHPEEATVRKTLHWHTHPVRTLAFLGSGPTSLLSGGEECVLVMWQLDRSSHRPSNFIARVGRGGIVHVLCCQSSDKIVVFCSDNSIQCFDASSSDRDWAEQGLASMALHEEDARGEGIVMVNDPITGLPMLTNLPGAPGMVHWYDSGSASVVGTLEVAPFNRVSRRDPINDPHVPAPAVTHLAVGRNGKDMVTVDIIWTENAGVGAARDLSGPKNAVAHMSVCTSVQFWKHVDPFRLNRRGGGGVGQCRWRNGEVPMSYELVSSMASPHGRGGGVCGLAVAPDGSTACTLSLEESAFRVWIKKKTADAVPAAGAAAAAPPSTLWKCLYRVKTPSGYANLLPPLVTLSMSGQGLVAFSSDGSVLAVAYGPCITLWDHADATLLTSVTLGDDMTVGRAGDVVQSLDFLTGDDDAMLLATAGQVGVKSPFGGVKSCYLGDDEWSLDAGSFGQGGVDILAVAPLRDAGWGGSFVVAVTSNSGSGSVVSVPRRDGSVLPVEGRDTSIQWAVDGVVQSLYVAKCSGSLISLLVILKDCRMLSLISGSDECVGEGITVSRLELQSTRNAITRAPVLKLGSQTSASMKSPVKRKKVSIGALQQSYGVPGLEFPALSGKFTSTFIARSLGKSDS